VVGDYAGLAVGLLFIGVRKHLGEVYGRLQWLDISRLRSWRFHAKEKSLEVER